MVTVSGTSMPHPVDPLRRLFFLIDISHLMKNLWNSLVTTDIVIAEDSCSRISHFLNLPPFHGKLSCQNSLDLLISTQNDPSKKVPIPVLALTHNVLHAKDTWAKMRVYPTKIIFSHKVASSLASFSLSNIITNDQKLYCRSMAAFIKLLATFRDIATQCKVTNQPSTPHYFNENHRPLFDLIANVSLT